MKISSVSLFSLIIVTSYVSAVVEAQSVSDNCNSTIQVKDLTPNATLLQCLNIWEQQNIILRYNNETVNGRSEWSFIVSAPDSNSYVGVGFSQDGAMVGSSAIVGWNPPDGNAMVKPYLLSGQIPPQVLVDRGDLKIVNGSLQFLSQGSRRYLAFKIEDVKPRQYVLIAIGPDGEFPSAPAYQLTQHRFKIAVSVNYVTGIQKQKTTRPYSQLRKAHGVINLLSWGVLIPIGAMTARYLKEWFPITWFYAHIAIQAAAFALGLLGIILGLRLEDKSQATNVSSHKGLGITILVIACLQLTALLARPDRETKWRKYWNWYHHNMGRIQIVLSLANIYYGISLADPGKAWDISYGFVIFVLITAAIPLELRKWKKRC